MCNLPCRTSGHVDKFADVMVKDLKSGQCYRADHLVQDHFEAELAKPKCPLEKKEEYEGIITTVSDWDPKYNIYTVHVLTILLDF